jgi:GDPmannose 4,6-dehydratase
MKKALITGITGQDGSYLAELLLEKGYEVYAPIRRSSVFNTRRIDPFFHHPNLKTYHGDLCDSSNIHRTLEKIQPDEIYNLAAQSHVAVSFEIPEYTAEVNALGTIRLLDGIRDTGVKTKLYQASTSEMFGGLPNSAPQDEKTPFYPRSPYAAAKLYAFWIVKNYREAYGIYACNGILFNHESPRRGETFVTKKITKAVARYIKNRKAPLKLGNLDAIRDWGYAKEYVECMWLMLQHEKAEDYVIGTGEMFSVRQFIELAFQEVGVNIIWKGKNQGEKGFNAANGDLLVEIDPKYYRPTEVEVLCANPSKAKSLLGWQPQTTLPQLVKLMVRYDLEHEDYGGTEKGF